MSVSKTDLACIVPGVQQVVGIADIASHLGKLGLDLVKLMNNLFVEKILNYGAIKELDKKIEELDLRIEWERPLRGKIRIEDYDTVFASKQECLIAIQYLKGNFKLLDDEIEDLETRLNRCRVSMFVQEDGESPEDRLQRIGREEIKLTTKLRETKELRKQKSAKFMLPEFDQHLSGLILGVERALPGVGTAVSLHRSRHLFSDPKKTEHEDEQEDEQDTIYSTLKSKLKELGIVDYEDRLTFKRN